MNVLRAGLAGLMPLLFAIVASAQSGHMVDGSTVDYGWMWGYGGIGLPILVFIAIAGLVLWLVTQTGD